MPTNEELIDLEENTQIDDNIQNDDIPTIPSVSINNPIVLDKEYYHQLESLFNIYFNTLEEQKKIDEEKQKEEEENQKELDKLDEELTLNSQEFQTQLITEIKVLQDYQQYQNNLTFFGILIFLIIFVSTLIYKFFKIFI